MALRAGYLLWLPRLPKVTKIEGWCQTLLDPRGKRGAVDGAIEQERRDDAVVAQPREEGQHPPMAMRYFGDRDRCFFNTTTCKA